MKTCVVYDSVYGNTEKVARAIGDAIPGEVQVLRADQVSASELETLDLLIVGAPTYGGRTTDSIQGLLQNVLGAALKCTKVAAFDTILMAKWVRIFGYAAPRIAGSLKDKGGTLVGSPEGFFVKGTKGPLKEGETYSLHKETDHYQPAYTTSYLSKVHYDMWLGPAPNRPFNRNRFHYNWHWHWEYGNGDTGNQGPHQFDVARWGLGKNEYPVKVSSFGGFFIYDASNWINIRKSISAYEQT